MKLFQILSAIIVLTISSVNSQKDLMQYVEPAIAGKPLPNRPPQIESRVFNGKDVDQIEERS